MGFPMRVDDASPEPVIVEFRIKISYYGEWMEPSGLISLGAGRPHTVTYRIYHYTLPFRTARVY